MWNNKVIECRKTARRDLKTEAIGGCLPIYVRMGCCISRQIAQLGGERQQIWRQEGRRLRKVRIYII